jgi:hypothetical protein
MWWLRPRHEAKSVGAADVAGERMTVGDGGENDLALADKIICVTESAYEAFVADGWIGMGVWRSYKNH